MDKNAKIYLKNHLKTLSESELKEISDIAIITGNRVLYESIGEISNNSLEKNAKICENKELFFNVCKFGTGFSYDLFKGKTRDFRDENENSCLHYAAKYGNLQVFQTIYWIIYRFSKIIRHFIKENSDDFNKRNKLMETPLHYCIREGSFH